MRRSPLLTPAAAAPSPATATYTGKVRVLPPFVGEDENYPVTREDERCPFHLRGQLPAPSSGDAAMATFCTSAAEFLADHNVVILKLLAAREQAD